MTKKQMTLILTISGVILGAGMILNAIHYTVNWVWFVLLASIVYLYIRYKITGPIQMFARKFNMMVDYDLDVEGALEMTIEQYENAPTNGIKQMLMIHLGMAYYYNAKYDESVKTFNQINLNKVNILYHVLIFAFSAYSAYEMGDTETFNISLDRINEVKNRVGKKYVNFASNYAEILHAIKNLEIDPESYREIVEKNFSHDDGYISTKLVYNYRMAHYHKIMNNIEEMDICLAKVIANGKNHHTAIQARKMFQNTVNVDDYVFPEPGTEVEDVETVEEPEQIAPIEDLESMEEIEVVEEVETEEDKTEE